MWKATAEHDLSPSQATTDMEAELDTHVSHETNWLSIAQRFTTQTSLPDPRVHSRPSWTMNVEYCLYTDNSAQEYGAHLHGQIDKLHSSEILSRNQFNHIYPGFCK